MASRVGVDVGGTFTDVIFYNDRTGETGVAKVPTTPTSPDEGVLNGVSETLSEELLGECGYFLHGTTVGLNALLQHRGASVGLLSTRGLRDVLEIRRGDRAEMFNLFWHQPSALVPRRLRLPVTERMRADGSVHKPLKEEDVLDALATFRESGVTAVAVAFINAYANPAHELEAERIMREAGFKGPISLSHRVSGEYREFERTSTTVIDAFVRAPMGDYLTRLEAALRGRGFDGDAMVTRSGGGAMTFADAADRPFETILSGPVAGAQGAAELARQLNLGDVITADVGGTSFDTALITDGQPELLYEGEIAGYPVQTPWVDVRSIGAGGGSIAWVDVGGLLRVGPHSAGADPGPASYGRGGTEPTVTDAAFLLGMLGGGEIASGIHLDRAAAEAAVQPVAERLGLSTEEVARGVITIAAAGMANAIREITVERGRDPRDATLAAFGGAGPLFATAIARELAITTIVIPPYAGNFSAWGLLGADVTRTASRTRVLRLGPQAVGDANLLVDELFDHLVSDAAGGDADVLREVGLDIRYVGQEHPLTVAAPVERTGQITATAEQLRDMFAEQYGRIYGATLDQPVEIVHVRATTRRPLPRRQNGRGLAIAPSQSHEGVRAYSFERGEWLSFAVADRAGLASGDSLVGPAIVLEETATTYLDAGFTATVVSGSLLITSKEGRS